MKNKPLFDSKGHVVQVVTIVIYLFLLTCTSFLLFSSEEKNTTHPKNNDKPLSAVSCLKQTIESMEHLPSFSSEFQLKLFLFGEMYSGLGKYQELSFRNERRTVTTPSSTLLVQASGNTVPGKEDTFTYTEKRSPLEWNSFRFHVRMFSEDAKAIMPNAKENLLEIVCDRQGLWTYTSIEGQTQLTFLNIESLANSFSKLSSQEQKVLMENGVDNPCGMSGLPGLGGLAGSLKYLLVNYDFESNGVQEVLCGKDFPAWKLTGQLKKNKLDKIKKNFEKSIAPQTDNFYEFLPIQVEVFIGRISKFPCQIKYYGLQSQSKEQICPLLEMNFSRIILNDNKVQPEDFVYRTPQKTYTIINEPYLQQLIPGVEL